MFKPPLDKIVNTDDLERSARRYLPRMLYDWIAGGAGDESGLRENSETFRRFRFLPRYLRDVGACSISRRVLDRAEHPLDRRDRHPSHTPSILFLEIISN